MAFKSLNEIEQICRDKGCSFGDAIMLDDMNERGVTRDESVREIAKLWQAMVDSAKSYDPNRHSSSGLSGGDGGKMRSYVGNGQAISGDFMGRVIASALEMGECNACMMRIVAAPTAGSCGVLPAVLLNYCDKYEPSESDIYGALYTAAGIGQVIATRAYIAGAMGGCQAEIGAASAMAAGALVFLKGGTPGQISNAAAMSLKNLLGLVCDPVGGLVEVPCVKRNVVGGVNAVAAADMALAGITSKIAPDDVIDAMKEVGDKMDRSLRETGEGGLAATPSAQSLLHGDA